MNKRLMKPLAVALLTMLICIFSLSADAPAQFAVHKEEQFKKPEKLQYNSKDLDCLTKNIFFEANTQTMRGKIAVAYVVINRKKDDNYPNSVCGIIYQKTRDKKTGKTVAMFSWTKNKTSYKIPYQEWHESRAIAECVLTRKCPDYLNGATHFHNTSVVPSWSRKLKFVGKIDDHKYYKEI